MRDLLHLNHRLVSHYVIGPCDVCKRAFRGSLPTVDTSFDDELCMGRCLCINSSASHHLKGLSHYGACEGELVITEGRRVGCRVENDGMHSDCDGYVKVFSFFL